MRQALKVLWRINDVVKVIVWINCIEAFNCSVKNIGYSVTLLAPVNSLSKTLKYNIALITYVKFYLIG